MAGLDGFGTADFEASTVIQAGNSQRVNMKNLRARLVALCAIGEDGKRLFAEADLKKLGGKSALVMDRLFDAARNLSGMSSRDVEKLAEGLGDAQNDSSTSD